MSGRLKKYFTTPLVCLISVLILFAAFLVASGGGGALDNDNRSHSEFVRARVLSVGEKALLNDIPEGFDDYNLNFTCRILSGEHKGETVLAIQNISNYNNQNIAEVKAGDKVILTYVGAVSDDSGMTGIDEYTWYFAEYVRWEALWVLAAMFLFGLLLFGGMNGVKTAVSLALTCGAVFFVLIPAIFSGKNIYMWTVFTCLYIVVMTLCVVNGLRFLSLATGLGCVAGVAFSCIAVLVTDFAVSLTGFVDETSMYLSFIDMNGPCDLKGIVFASIIIGCVGAVMDVAVDISASLHEIAAKLEKPTFSELLSSGFTIGRDIMGTMSNTLILAHMGSSLGFVLLVIYNSSNSMMYLFNREIIIVEGMKILIGSLGILMTIPFNTLVCAWLYSMPRFARHLHYDQAEGDTDEATKTLMDIAKELKCDK